MLITVYATVLSITMGQVSCLENVDNLLSSRDTSIILYASLSLCEHCMCFCNRLFHLFLRVLIVLSSNFYLILSYTIINHACFVWVCAIMFYSSLCFNCIHCISRWSLKFYHILIQFTYTGNHSTFENQTLIRTTQTLCITLHMKEQVVKVIWQNASLPPHTDGPTVFARRRQCAPHVTHAFLGPSESTTQTASWTVQPCLHNSRQSVVRHARACPFPSKLPLRMGRSGPPSNTWFLEPTLAQNPNYISIGSAVFAQLTTERPYTLQRTVLPLCRVSDTTTLRLIIKPDSNNNNSHNCNQT